MRFCLLLLTCVSLSAQSVEKNVISAIGNSYNGQIFSVSYNTGELVIGSQSSEDGSIQLGSGYYPSLNLITLDVDIPENEARSILFEAHKAVPSMVFIDSSNKKVVLSGVGDIYNFLDEIFQGK